LIVGAIGTALCLSGVARVFYSNSHQSALLALLVGFIAFFALSQGLVVFVCIGEVFPNAVRSKGRAWATLALPLSIRRFSLLFPFWRTISTQARRSCSLPRLRWCS
jgi:hypothetical protein